MRNGEHRNKYVLVLEYKHNFATNAFNSNVLEIVIYQRARNLKSDTGFVSTDIFANERSHIITGDYL